MTRFATLLFGLIVLTSGVATAAPTAEQKAEIAAVGELMSKAGALFKEKKFGESAAVIAEVQEKVAKLAESGDAIILKQLETPHKQLSKAHALLELEGIEVPELMPLPSATKPKKPEKPEKPTKPMPEPADNTGVSFVKHVVPVLVGRCGKCHVEQSKGDFSAASYAALMKGAGTAGKVIFPGDADGSRIIEVIVSGDMPRGGKLAPQEFEVLKQWIKAGAKFDGNDENASILGLTKVAVSTTPAVEPMVVQATGKETISFARDVASVLSANCNGCHGTNRPRENFSVATFTSLMKGGDGGPAVTPGKGAESLIVKKLKGTAGGARMPMNAPPLADPVIAKIEKWIDEGATFDGPDAGMPLTRVAAIAKASGSTHAELSADRMETAKLTWATAMPGVKFDSVETTNFYAQGTVGENTLKDLLDKAEAQMPRVAEILGAPTDKALVKGRFTVFAVNVRYDFGEIGKVLLNTTNVPAKASGLWHYSGVDAAGVVYVPKSEGDYSVPAIIGDQAAAAYVSGIGKNVPHWFAEGVGHVVASRLAASDPRVREWDAAWPAVHGSLSSPDAFMSNKFDSDMASVASYSFARYLMTDSKKFNRLLDDLRAGGKFDAVFNSAYSGTPSQVAERWFTKGAKAPRPTKGATTKSAKGD
jgi:mono/diheme cytochrome c family protein